MAMDPNDETPPPMPFMSGQAMTVTIRSFREGGFGLLNANGEVLKAASSLDEVLRHIDRAAHGVFAPPERSMAQRFSPPVAQLPEPGDPERRTLGSRLRNVVGSRG